MNNTLTIDNQTLDFKFNETANCWQAITFIDNEEIKIEIDFQFQKQSEVDWQHFSNFFKFLNYKNRLNELVDKSMPLISELGKAFYRNSIHEIKEWKMIFKHSIYYNGKVDELNNSEKYSFSLLFDYCASKNNITDGDAYGLYIVDIEDLQIVGARRFQC